MTIRKFYEVQCDIPSCLDSEHLDAGAVNAQEMRAAAKRAGWKIRNVNGRQQHICPRCQRKGKETP